MPLVGPLHKVVLFVAIPFVGFVGNLVVASFALHQVIVPKLAPPRLQCTFELYPLAFELISVHGVFLLCEVARPWRGRSGPLLHIWRAMRSMREVLVGAIRSTSRE